MLSSKLSKTWHINKVLKALSSRTETASSLYHDADWNAGVDYDDPDDIENEENNEDEEYDNEEDENEDQLE
jgi:hypothetical protein